MKCEQQPEVAERYVTDQLAEDERSAFEQHFFECAACLTRVQDLQILQETLAAAPAAEPAVGRFHLRAVHGWLAVAAAAVLAVILWSTGGAGDRGLPSGASTIASRNPAAAPASTPVQSGGVSLESTLARLSEVAPPRYVPLSMRSDADEDARAFDAAMRKYAAGNYALAARALAPLVRPSLDLPHAAFFLGISELMTGRLEEARFVLERTTASGAAPYADEAHFYLAKIALRTGQVDVAARELQIAVRREAGPPLEAARLLGEVQKLAR